MTRTPGPRDPEQSFGDEASIKADRHRVGPDTAGSETRLIGKNYVRLLCLSQRLEILYRQMSDSVTNSYLDASCDALPQASRFCHRRAIAHLSK